MVFAKMLSANRHKQAASTDGTNFQLWWLTGLLFLMAPVGNGLLGEVHRAFGELNERPIDLREPHCPSILYQPGIDRDTILHPTAEGSAGAAVMVNPVAVCSPQERWQH
jgi:hypothetical protein